MARTYAPQETRTAILDAVRRRVVDGGIAKLSTRGISAEAGVPLSQIHYHFGGKYQLLLALLDRETERLLERQAEMYGEDGPLWKRWEQACDFLDDDLRSGYVQVLQEMIAAGWSDPEIAQRVREALRGWFRLLTEVAEHAATRLGGLGPFSTDETAALIGNAFLGTEASILLGFSEEELPSRSALRRIGALIRSAEETGR